ncbi:putative rab subfamily of small GTPases [Lyophyllum shimeji]|uniref:Rab subfamily of small GTPases n=1 Tax=Lyophyllum shimeji TaxID=47721 RepID=A0A9P3PIL9_LYOSH|nr:putative rab subfamily of small GTPases [Lyophyllum shimeji]
MNDYEADATELLETYDFLMKYIIIGEAGTGKSCLLHHFTHNTFKDHSQHTIGVEFSSRTVRLGEKRIKLQLWDTAGQERFRSVTRSYYRGAAGAILVYDITNRDSFVNLSRWLADARALGSPHLVSVLVGNKSDREEDREVEWAEASRWAAENDVHFLEASSLTGDNVEAPFLLAARSILLSIESGALDPEKAGSGQVLRDTHSREAATPPTAYPTGPLPLSLMRLQPVLSCPAFGFTPYPYVSYTIFHFMIYSHVRLFPTLNRSLTSTASTDPASASSTTSLSFGIIPGKTSGQSGSLAQSMSSVPSHPTTFRSNTVPPVASAKPPAVPTTMSQPPSTSTRSPIKGVTTSPTGPAPGPPTTSTTTTNPTTTTKTSSTSHTEPPTTSPTPSSSTSTGPIIPVTQPRTTTETSIQGLTPTRTRTSTITDRPVSTFSSPVAVSVVDPNNGRVSLTTPAVVTVFSTSSGANGELVTFTHVVANPTGFSAENQVSSAGFLGNHGAAAAVFVVNRRQRWLAGLQQPMPSNPFEDPSDPPPMRSVNDNHQDINWDGSAPFAFGNEEPRRLSMHSSSSHHHNDVTPLVGIGSGMSPRRVPVPKDDLYTNESRVVGFGVGYGRAFNDDRRDRASLAQSSPSIYPASLPPSGDEETIDATQSPISEHSSGSSSRKVVAGAPPRPPRSHLRRSITKPYDVYPVTPPTSVSSHAPSKPPSPILDQTKVTGRRTLLDVRPRPGQESAVQ